MCGIFGYFGRSSHSEATIAKSLQVSRHRGPDQQAYQRFDNGFLGHVRLSIIDLSERGKQPMFDTQGKSWIVFNGEIYNFKKLRAALEQEHQFRSQTDTEVLLHGYHQWGIEGLLECIEGMFAFVIYDAHQNILVGARDHVGKKPLYYFHDQADGFGFSSTIQSLQVITPFRFTVNDAAVHEYLIKSFISQPQTIYKQAKSLMPGEYFRYDTQHRSLVICRYWNPDFSREEERPEEDWMCDIKESIIQAVEKRLVADVPIGAFLSGGIDSSLITSICLKELGFKLQTFTVRFPIEKYNEADVANKISHFLGSEHSEISAGTISPEEIEQIIEYFGQPFGDHSAIPTYMIAKHASERVKVVLTGDGGDEGFAGYTTSLAIQASEQLSPLLSLPPLKQILSKVPFLKRNKYVEWVRATNQRKEGYYVFDPHGRKGFRKFLSEMRYGTLDVDTPEMETWKSVQGDWVRRGQVVDFRYFLPYDYLVKTDVTTMAHGFEARSPLLDKNLILLAFRIPSSLKLKNKQTKYLLRQLLGSYLPQDITGLPKKGFSFTVDGWIAQHLPWVARTLDGAMCFLESYVSPALIMKLLDDHRHRQQSGRQLWLLLILALWYQKSRI